MATGNEWDWHQLAFQSGTSLLSGIGGLLFGVWKWGRKSAKDERSVKDDYETQIRALGKEMRTDMAAYAQKTDAGNDLLVSQFKESFEGIRRQHDEHKLDVEKRFLPKDDFKDFREEYREDIRDIKASIASITR